ncbi:DUF3348 family protein [Marinobacter litoralis]|uniref:DUF3348 family protein n=1 Tax=Marinobacter litoralis TaxID=187981 RepID=UPI001D106307|nr:DUF3348 family protein [Marinobacter litoralis]
MDPMASVQSGSAHARLLQLLATGDAPRKPHNLPCFAERLSRLFGLGDTMSLDAATAFRSRQPGMNQEAVFEQLTKELSNIRRALRRKIGRYGEEVEAGDSVTAETYLNAWLVLQRKVAASSRQLRDKVRKAMKDHNQDLARLAELDSVFDHTMASYTSQCFSHISKVLEQRFHSLQPSSDSPPETGHTPDDWLHRYCEDSQNLLLAELDVRLEPVLGLLEACHNEVNHSP